MDRKILPGFFALLVETVRSRRAQGDRAVRFGSPAPERQAGARSCTLPLPFSFGA